MAYRKKIQPVAAKQADQFYRGCLLHFNPFTGCWVAIKDSFRIYSHEDIERVKGELDVVYAEAA